MQIRASQIAAVTGGTLAGPDVAVDGAHYDSRELQPGQLFVPLVAARDGHDFVAAALAAGAAAYLADRQPTAGGTAIVVDDTEEALTALARWVRSHLDVPVVGITGSVGKTSTKDLTAAALGATRRVWANERSFNNQWGLPVTVLGTPPGTEVLVLEMGMNAFGEIATLASIGRPTVGVVTNVAGAHTGPLGGIDGVARAKRELVEALPASGTAVLNVDDPRVAAMAPATEASVLTFGETGDVRIGELVLDELARPAFRVDSPWGHADVRLAVSGRHMAWNAAAAVAVVGAVTGSIEAAAGALADAGVSGRRMEVGRSRSGAVVVNDAYNANPDSMRAALDALAAIAASRRIAVLGPMAELDDPAAGHTQVAADARERGIELVAIGTDLYGVTPVAASAASFDPTVLGPLGEETAVLVKASNSARLWLAADILTAH
ncbi:MAG TPA: UDP-N-acetylmuramoyl-tripeptide--D-alanyl-D-alanine ligase [Ilumatobacter sp.]|nr:UDP-N-acetylmuramoyl-tripeptide--D-alanyl-D-alanine ligase [Ilumatobacter sp.]